MKHIPLLLTTLLSTMLSAAFAQTASDIAVKRMRDSMKFEAISEYAKSYPQLRQGFLTTDIIGQGNVKAQLNGKDLYEGKMNITRIRSSFNIPFAQWGKNAITGSIAYQQARYETNEIKSYDPQFNVTNQTVTKTRVGFSAIYTRSDSLFNHPINYSGSVTGITDELSSIKRVNYMGSITVPLKRNQYSSLTIGMVVILDPSAVSPVIPIISYWHKYKDANLELFVDLPSRIALRKQLSKKSWVSVGSELGSNLFFFDLNQPSLPQNAIYTSVELRSGATFEYLLTKKLILGVNGGMLTTASSRLFDHNDKPTDYFANTRNASVPYISFSISFLPFLKPISKR
jgi:hypothetical protein